MIHLIPMKADAASPTKLTAYLPAGNDWAIIGFVGLLDVAQSYDVTSLRSSNGSGPLVGSKIRMDALVSGESGPAQPFPGPGNARLGIPGSAWPVPSAAEITMEITANGIAAGAPSTDENTASVHVLVVPIADNNDPAIPRTVIANTLFAIAAGTLATGTNNVKATLSAQGKRARFLSLQGRKTQTDGTEVSLSIADSEFLSISRLGDATTRLPLRGRAPLAAIAGDYLFSNAGLAPGEIGLDILGGDQIQFDYYNSGDGLAQTKDLTLALFGYEYA